MVKIVIEYDPENGSLQLQVPLHKPMALFVLEAARDAIKANKTCGPPPIVEGSEASLGDLLSRLRLGPNGPSQGR